VRQKHEAEETAAKAKNAGWWDGFSSGFFFFVVLAAAALAAAAEEQKKPVDREVVQTFVTTIFKSAAR